MRGDVPTKISLTARTRHLHEIPFEQCRGTQDRTSLILESHFRFPFFFRRPPWSKIIMTDLALFSLFFVSFFDWWEQILTKLISHHSSFFVARRGVRGMVCLTHPHDYHVQYVCTYSELSTPSHLVSCRRSPLLVTTAVDSHGFLVVGHIIEDDQVCICLVCHPFCCRGVPNMLGEMAAQHATTIRLPASTFDSVFSMFHGHY